MEQDPAASNQTPAPAAGGPTTSGTPPQPAPKKSYGKRPVWQWIVIYLVVAIVVYFIIYWLFFHHSGSSGTTSGY